MTLDEIRELIAVVIDTGVSELEVQRGEDRVRIRRGLINRRPDIVLPEPREQAAAPVAAPVAATAAATVSSDAMADPSLVMVKSPIVGTYYDAPSPGSSSFVQVGDTVQPGKVLCIIESMKLMNEIESEVGGTVVAKLVVNASPVEYGESLFAIRPF